MKIQSQKETVAMLTTGRMFELERLVEEKSIGRIHNLMIESYGDRIELTGETNTYYAKQLVTQIVREKYKDVELVNNIVVL